MAEHLHLPDEDVRRSRPHLGEMDRSPAAAIAKLLIEPFNAPAGNTFGGPGNVNGVTHVLYIPIRRARPISE
ncbi:protein of unknown function [Agrobacterium pusense]|uniref:Uncharacterized protein n=1 Tax=Agrobacterium pusense TaxID=648995 RepID=U4QGS7_9HYPH|nr:protein of unknown function [Agrobacterium pusense]